MKLKSRRIFIRGQVNALPIFKYMKFELLMELLGRIQQMARNQDLRCGTKSQKWMKFFREGEKGLRIVIWAVGLDQKSQ